MGRGPAPYGQRYQEEALVDDPAEQATLEHIRVLRAQGLGAVSVTKALNDQGYLCRGSKWHRTTIRRILKRMGATPLED